jgi:hypothetical protein
MSINKNSVSFYFKRMVQVALGLFLLTNVPIGWHTPLQDLGLPKDAQDFFLKLWEINLIMPVVKGIELLAGLAFIFNRYTFVGLLIFYPVLFNIACMSGHFFGGIRYLLPMMMGIFYLSWVHRKDFIQLFTART